MRRIELCSSPGRIPSSRYIIIGLAQASANCCKDNSLSSGAWRATSLAGAFIRDVISPCSTVDSTEATCRSNSSLVLQGSWTERYTMLTPFIPLPNTRVHHCACLPEGLGDISTALTAEWSVKTFTEFPYR